MAKISRLLIPAHPGIGITLQTTFADIARIIRVTDKLELAKLRQINLKLYIMI